MRLTNTVLILFSVLLLVGCGSKQSGITPDPTTKDIPKWFLNKPSDPDFHFETGTATSRDLQLAQDKAGDAARMNMAKWIETKFKGLSDRLQEEVGTGEDAQYLDQFTQATRAVVSTTLTGVSVDKSEVVVDGGLYRVYVLMKMPIGASSAALQNKLKQQEQMYTRFRKTQVFEDLEEQTTKFEDFKKEQGMP